jgi:aryl-alcohol dehydrogenase-like predicted oxidoreductase
MVGVYGPFKNERLLGNTFAGKRDQVAISTKVGFRGNTLK